LLTQIILINFESKQYYAHNLLFDFSQFLPGLLKFNIKFEWTFLEYRLYGVKIYYLNKIIHLKCSYKLIPYTIANFYPVLSDYQKLPFPYRALEKWNPHESCLHYVEIPAEYKNLTIDEYLEIYAKRDLVILKQGIERIFDTFKTLSIQFSKNTYTCGSIALKYYIQKWNKIDLHLKIEHKNIIRSAYYGGRTEVFGNPRPHEKILHFDYSGMYQQCMLESLPYGDFEFIVTSAIIGPGFYFIKTEFKNEFPVLPSKEEKLFFKEGYVEGWFWFEEIELFKQTSKITYLEILHGMVTTKYSPVLAEFINSLNEIRKAGGIKKELGKLLINSFYGRLGMGEELCLMNIADDNFSLKTYGIINDYFLLKKKIKKNPKANVAIAAAVTAKARIKLYRGFLEVIKHSGRILYCDTDSIFAAFPKDKSVENKPLGEIIFNTNMPGTCIKDAVFIKPKTYGLAFEKYEIIKIKGADASTILFENLKKNFYKNEQLTVLNTHFYKKNLEINILQVKKDIQLRDYDKRIWGDDLTSTQPIFNKRNLQAHER